MRLFVLARLLTVTLVASSAVTLAHADLVKPMAPTWCGTYKPDANDTMSGYVETYGKDGFSWRFIGTLAKASCDKPDDAARRKLVAQWRQRYNDYYHLTDEEGRERLAVTLAETLEAAVKPVCKKLQTEDKHATLPDRARVRALGVVMGCGSADETLGWWVDDAAEVDPLLRTVWVRDQLRLGNLADDPDLDNSSYVTGYARGGHDARELDRGKLEAELAELGVTGPARLVALEFFGETKSEADKLTAFYRAKAEVDPAIKKALFDVPEAAFAAWVKDAETWSAALTDERAVIRNAWLGNAAELKTCSATMRKHLAAYLAARHPRTKEEAIDALTDHIGYRLSTAALVCDASVADMTAYGLQKLLDGAKLRRGPRVHAYHALLELGDTVKGFDARYLGRLEDKVEKLLIYSTPKIDFAWSEPKGVIAKLGPSKAGGVVVTFKTTRWSEAVWSCVMTHRIEKIEASGQVIYHQDCRTTGKSKSVSSTEKPVVVDKGHAASLKVGQFVFFVGDDTKKPGRGGPTFGYADTAQKKLVSVFGIPL
jgi:hypothetical protein